MPFFERGTRVEFDQPKNKKRHGKRGIITDMDRGNVYVKLDDGKTVCTRMALLKEPSLLDKIAEASADAADKRVGTEHEEIVTPGDRPLCKVCGYVDEGKPNREFHPEFYEGTIIVTKSPHEEDYEDADEAPPWIYREDGFVSWVDEVFFEGYKSDEPCTLTVEECVEELRGLGYEVEVNL